jgi:hypothetical protein
MAKQKGRPENLIPIQSRATEAQRAIRSKGGKVCAEKKRERILLSEILSGYLQKEHNVTIRDNTGAVIDTKKLPADKLIEETISTILARGDSASASIIKTLGELTEGSKLRLGGLNGDAIPFEYVDAPKKNESPE